MNLKIIYRNYFWNALEKKSNERKGKNKKSEWKCQFIKIKYYTVFA